MSQTTTGEGQQMREPRLGDRGRRVRGRAKKIHYTHKDAQGVRWRFAGGRPVSEIADAVMRDCNFPIPK
jgi:hypothetical protein